MDILRQTLMYHVFVILGSIHVFEGGGGHSMHTSLSRDTLICGEAF